MWRRQSKKITSTPKTEEVENRAGDNPYLQSRQLYNDIYGNAEQRYRRSRYLNYFLTGSILVAILGIIYIGSQSKYVPYVVQVQDGIVVYGNVAQQSNIDDQRPLLAVYFLRDFLSSARSVSVDGGNNASQEKKAFAFTTGMATTTLSDYIDHYDPMTVAEDHTVTVKINYINKTAGNSYQCGWTEVYRDSANGQINGTKKFNGVFTSEWGKSSQNKSILENNPFGFYITSIAWTEVSGA